MAHAGNLVGGDELVSAVLVGQTGAGPGPQLHRDVAVDQLIAGPAGRDLTRDGLF